MREDHVVKGGTLVGGTHVEFGRAGLTWKGAVGRKGALAWADIATVGKPRTVFAPRILLPVVAAPLVFLAALFVGLLPLEQDLAIAIGAALILSLRLRTTFVLVGQDHRFALIEGARDGALQAAEWHFLALRGEDSGEKLHSAAST